MTDPAASPTRLYLVRHGEVEGDHVLHGHVDVSLTPRGVEQLHAVSARLAPEPLCAVYSSDLQRSRLGAQAVAAPHRLPVTSWEAFRELAMGEWDGRPLREVWEGDRERLEHWWADIEGYVLPGGESLRLLSARVLTALAAVLDRHASEAVCLVAHGGVNRVILFDALGLPLAHYHKLVQDYGCVNVIDYHADGNRVVRLVNG